VPSLFLDSTSALITVEYIAGISTARKVLASISVILPWLASIGMGFCFINFAREGVEVLFGNPMPPKILCAASLICTLGVPESRTSIG
jgi:hypothetical protein